MVNRFSRTLYIKLFIIILAILLSSCSQQILVQYSVISDQGTFKVLTDTEEVAERYWSKEMFSDGEVSIYVVPQEQSQILDVRVLYIANNGLEMYNRKIGEGPILIKGKIHPLP